MAAGQMYRWPITCPVNSDVLHLHWSQHEKANHPSSSYNPPKTNVIWYSRLILTESWSCAHQPIHHILYIRIYIYIRSIPSSIFHQTVLVSRTGLSPHVVKFAEWLTAWTCNSSTNSQQTWSEITANTFETKCKKKCYHPPMITRSKRKTPVRQSELKSISVSTPFFHERSPAVRRIPFIRNQVTPQRTRKMTRNFLGSTAPDIAHRNCRVSSSTLILCLHSYQYQIYCFSNTLFWNESRFSL